MINLIPLAIAAIVAGTAANMEGQRRRRSAENRAARDYAERLQGRSKEAQAIFERSIGDQDVERSNAAIEGATQAKIERVDNLRESESGFIDPMLAGQSRAPKVIQNTVSKSLADELAKARAQIGALAKLEGFSTRTFDRGLELDAAKPLFRNIALFAEGDRNVYGAKHAAAQRKGEGWRLAGDLLTGIGGVLGGGWGTAAAAGSKAYTTYMDTPTQMQDVVVPYYGGFDDKPQTRLS